MGLLARKDVCILQSPSQGPVSLNPLTLPGRGKKSGKAGPAGTSHHKTLPLSVSFLFRTRLELRPELF